MIKVVAIIFVLYAVYVASIVYTQPNIFGVIVGVLSLAAGIGLWLHKRWSQYCVYIVSFGVAGQWLWAASSYYYQNGWPHEQTFGHIVKRDAL